MSHRVAGFREAVVRGASGQGLRDCSEPTAGSNPQDWSASGITDSPTLGEAPQNHCSKELLNSYLAALPSRAISGKIPCNSHKKVTLQGEEWLHL